MSASKKLAARPAHAFRRTLFLGLGVGAVAWLALGGSGSYLGPPAYADEAAGTVIKIDNFTFTPPTLTVPVGTTVTWVNEDDIPHAIAERTRAFKSKALDTDDKFAYTFSTPGSFDYFCSLHPHMVGKVVVQPGNPPS